MIQRLKLAQVYWRTMLMEWALPALAQLATAQLVMMFVVKLKLVQGSKMGARSFSW